MSLKINLFATLVDNVVCIHDSMFDLYQSDFAALVLNECKDPKSNKQFIPVAVGQRTTNMETSIFTSYAYKQLDSQPIPLLNQPLSKQKKEKDKFSHSRYWAFKRYFFVTNRPYQLEEEDELRVRILYFVLKNEEEFKKIQSELKS